MAEIASQRDTEQNVPCLWKYIVPKSMRVFYSTMIFEPIRHSITVDTMLGQRRQWDLIIPKYYPANTIR